MPSLRRAEKEPGQLPGHASYQNLGLPCGLRVGVAFDVLHQSANGLNVLHFLVGDFHLELVLDGHQQVHNVQGIGAQVVRKRGFRGDGILLNIELLAENRLDFFKHHFLFLLSFCSKRVLGGRAFWGIWTNPAFL